MPPVLTPPASWVEVFPIDEPGIQAALGLLQTTFPTRYQKYHQNDVSPLQRKMRFSQGPSLSSLRIFTWNDSAPRIAAFFFLRYAYPPVAYCLSVGIDNDTTFPTGQALHKQLIAIAKFVQNFALVDIVNFQNINNKNNSGEDDMNDTGLSVIVRDAFIHGRDHAAKKTLPPNSAALSQPNSLAWPPDLKRWQVVKQ